MNNQDRLSLKLAQLELSKVDLKSTEAVETWRKKWESEEPHLAESFSGLALIALQSPTEFLKDKLKIITRVASLPFEFWLAFVTAGLVIVWFTFPAPVFWGVLIVLAAPTTSWAFKYFAPLLPLLAFRSLGYAIAMSGLAGQFLEMHPKIEAKQAEVQLQDTEDQNQVKKEATVGLKLGDRANANTILNIAKILLGVGIVWLTIRDILPNKKNENEFSIL